MSAGADEGAVGLTVAAAPVCAGLTARYRLVRARSLALAEPLSAEDQAAQSMPDASPVKWHLAHTTWFFETFVLARRPGHAPFDPAFGYLFNSYYEAVGPRHARPQRGLLTRPSAAQVRAYRRHVDERMEAMLEAGLDRATETLVVLGLAHEEQHQELILTDVLHLFAQNPLKPAYRSAPPAATPDPGPAAWVDFAGGTVEIGVSADAGFSFDNEGPAHAVLLGPYRLADRLVTNAEWIAFIGDGGYSTASLWLAEGWDKVRTEGWTAPLYWERGEDGGWSSLTPSGFAPVDLHAPVRHLSYYEADAYAAWTGARLPTEAEWEHAARTHPAALHGLYGQAWQWTASAYTPYPGFRAAPGAVGEYNGKFMVSQMVLRGGSCATADGHSRPSYRNFFPPWARWQFAGLRLAQNAPPPAAVAPEPRSSEAARDPAAGFRRDMVEGLSRPQKTIPAKWFYDAEGSRLFDAICETEEYYPTRTETALLRRIAPEIAARIPAGAVLVEFGSGASLKTRLLLDAAPQLSAYVPIDISPEALAAAADAIARAYPALQVSPVVGDFTRPLTLPPQADARPRVGFFPGSTIGNFDAGEARAFLAETRARLGAGARLVVGIDLVKAPAVLEAAYDDASGVTAAFNLNLLVRANRELGADFDLAGFAHSARWNPAERRMEMHLVARRAQTATLAGRAFDFREGETIHTENSHKFTVEGFAELAEGAGWRLERSWTSPAPAFAVVLLG